MIVPSNRRVAATRAAFTLMEVLVVVAILVVLAGTGGVVYMRYLDKAKIDVARTQLQALTTACDTFAVANGDYPPTIAVLTQPQADGTRPYLEPSALIDPWGRPYQYAYPGQHHQMTGKPDIWSGGAQPGNPAGMIGNWLATNMGQ